MILAQRARDAMPTCRHYARRCYLPSRRARHGPRARARRHYRLDASRAHRAQTARQQRTQRAGKSRRVIYTSRDAHFRLHNIFVMMTRADARMRCAPFLIVNEISLPGLDYHWHIVRQKKTIIADAGWSMRQRPMPAVT